MNNSLWRVGDGSWPSDLHPALKTLWVKTQTLRLWLDNRINGCVYGEDRKTTFVNECDGNTKQRICVMRVKIVKKKKKHPIIIYRYSKTDSVTKKLTDDMKRKKCYTRSGSVSTCPTNERQTKKTGMSRYNFFSSSTATWGICLYRYQSISLFLVVVISPFTTCRTTWSFGRRCLIRWITGVLYFTFKS